METEFRDPQKWRGLPSMALPAICYMDQYLTKDMRVFEWGSGGSTLFFLRRVELVTTIEHEKEWFDKVNEACCYIAKRASHEFNWIPPLDEPSSRYSSQWPGWAGWSFEKYVNRISDYPGNYYDLISVDGRSRSACLLEASYRLRAGGLLILDDAQRDRYKEAMSQIEMPYIDFVGDIPYQEPGLKVQTRIWINVSRET